MKGRVIYFIRRDEFTWYAMVGLDAISAGGEGDSKDAAIRAATENWKWLLQKMAADNSWNKVE